MSKPRWSNIGIRSYELKSEVAQAFVFGAYRPACLWAWSVYWNGGNKSCVESSFRDAKTKAQIVVKELEAYGDIAR